MSIFESVILGLIQALTEFLPVSSSGHLVLFQHLLEVTEANLAFDILLHLATLLVVFVYLRKDILQVLAKLFSKCDSGKRARKLALLVIVASIPAAVVGLGFKDLIRDAFKSVGAAGVGFAITTSFLLLAERFYKPSGDDNSEWPLPSFKQAILIGLAQAVAITPGVSRSGSTIAASLISGLPVESSLRFSFFISIPAILGAALLEIGALADFQKDSFLALGLGFVTATVAGFFALRMLVLVAKEKRLKVFAYYTGILAILSFTLSYLG